jgi:hypothetical protein
MPYSGKQQPTLTWSTTACARQISYSAVFETLGRSMCAIATEPIAWPAPLPPHFSTASLGDLAASVKFPAVVAETCPLQTMCRALRTTVVFLEHIYTHTSLPQTADGDCVVEAAHCSSARLLKTDTKLTRSAPAVSTAPSSFLQLRG